MEPTAPTNNSDSQRVQWLGSLTVGDEVMILEPNYTTHTKIISITKMYITTEGGFRFRRTDGHRPGNHFFTYRIEPVTPKRLARVRKRKLIYAIDRVDWTRANLELLEKIWETVVLGLRNQVDEELDYGEEGHDELDKFTDPSQIRIGFDPEEYND